MPLGSGTPLVGMSGIPTSGSCACAAPASHAAATMPVSFMQIPAKEETRPLQRIITMKA
jgi:hypothetical protein